MPEESISVIKNILEKASSAINFFISILSLILLNITITIMIKVIIYKL